MVGEVLPAEVTFEKFLQDQNNLAGQRVGGTGENVPGTGNSMNKRSTPKADGDCMKLRDRLWPGRNLGHLEGLPQLRGAAASYSSQSLARWK